MERIINDVIELDKEARYEVEQLQIEKSKIGEFLREERKRLEKEMKDSANKTIQETKDEIALDLKDRTVSTKSDYQSTLKKLEKSFNENKDLWVESIYQFCIQE